MSRSELIKKIISEKFSTLELPVGDFSDPRDYHEAIKNYHLGKRSDLEKSILDNIREMKMSGNSNNESFADKIAEHAKQLAYHTNEYNRHRKQLAEMGY